MTDVELISAADTIKLILNCDPDKSDDSVKEVKFLKDLEILANRGYVAGTFIRDISELDKKNIIDEGYKIVKRGEKTIVEWEFATKGHARIQRERSELLVKSMKHYCDVPIQEPSVVNILPISDIPSDSRKTIMSIYCYNPLLRNPDTSGDLRRIVTHKSTYPSEVLKKDLEEMLVGTFPLVKLTPISKTCIVVDLL